MLSRSGRGWKILYLPTRPITAVFTYHMKIYHWYDFHSKACKSNSLNILVTYPRQVILFTFKVLTLLKLVKTVRCAECLSFCVTERRWLRHFVVGVKLVLSRFISAVSRSWISFTCDVSGSSSTPFGGNTCVTVGCCSINGS